MSPNENPSINRRQKMVIMTLAILTGQVGCLTVVIILAAVLIGLWLDSHFGTRPKITLVLVLASIPVSVAAMFVATRAALTRIRSGARDLAAESKEVGKIGENND